MYNALDLMIKVKFKEFLNYINYPYFQFPDNIKYDFYNGSHPEYGKKDGFVKVPDNKDEPFILGLDLQIYRSAHLLS